MKPSPGSKVSLESSGKTLHNYCFHVSRHCSVTRTRGTTLTHRPHRRNSASSEPCLLATRPQTPIVHRVTLWQCSKIYALMLVHTLFLGFKAQAHLLARLSSCRILHYDFYGAISSQRGSLRGLDALWNGLQYMFQRFVDDRYATDVRVILTRFRLRCWYHDCHLGRQAIQRVLPHDPESPRDSCRHSMGVYWACSALRWWCLESAVTPW